MENPKYSGITTIDETRARAVVNGVPTFDFVLTGGHPRGIKEYFHANIQLQGRVVRFSKRGKQYTIRSGDRITFQFLSTISGPDASGYVDHSSLTCIL